jgi:hypothetical protein
MRTSSVFLRTPVRREALEIALSSMLRVVRMHQFLQYCMHPSSHAVRSEQKPGEQKPGRERLFLRLIPRHVIEFTPVPDFPTTHYESTF